jgi:predicted nucleic acid-binding protein
VKLLDTTVALDHLRGDRAAADLVRGLVENDETLAAATALILEAELLTTDVRHFPMPTDLEPPY